MSAIEIWTNGDRMVRQATGGAEVSMFVKQYLKEEINGKIHYDNAQFLSHHGWNGSVAGMAFVGTMCGSLSAAVNTVSKYVIPRMGAISHTFRGQ